MKIGVFDSGIGGKLIAEKISKKVPEIKIVVRSDPEYFPYGNKSSEVIYKRLVYFTRELAKMNCGIVVIACNSATTSSIAVLRNEFPKMLFVGVEPPIKPIIELTKTGKVAVMGTEATIVSRRFEELRRKFNDGKKVIGIACPGLAEEIEYKWRLGYHSFAAVRQSQIKSEIDKLQLTKRAPCLNFIFRKGYPNGRSIAARRRYPSPPLENSVLINLIKKYLDKPVAEGVDVVGLGCTHYPYILPLLKKLYPKVIFYDPAEAVADQVARLVQK